MTDETQQRRRIGIESVFRRDVAPAMMMNLSTFGNRVEDATDVPPAVLTGGFITEPHEPTKGAVLFLALALIGDAIENLWLRFRKADRHQNNLASR